MSIMNAGERILQCYRDCLSREAPIAPVELVEDSQTRKMLDRIWSDSSNPRILDYGCGTLRLLNALKSKSPHSTWTYFGADVSDPRETHPREAEELCGHLPPSKARLGTIVELRDSSERFDVAVLMNVLHELPIESIPIVFEDLRRHLSANGRALVMDTVLLLTGEPLFVPFYPW